ncbi:MAG: UDP-N-acetylmuramoyl-tripeptide--D-alanyl-D-alanine ligase [Candidatus Eisenbacteria bacterium]|nr:UDP-N-acetylmuramoyl-tripeptide--D-alanyl-D-alanine ligase [Candidatus Eisenbacteria bacterium]
MKDVLDGTRLEAYLRGKVTDSGRGRQTVFTGFSIDTRTLKRGEIFFALKGPSFDGNDFIPEAFQKGAAAAVCSLEWFRKEGDSLADRLLIPSGDTLASLQELSSFHRRKFKLPLVAVTGTNGKTTTKEMIAACLGQKGKVLKTEGNLNNHIGVPLTLLGLSLEHSTAVLELGMSRRGEIRRLAEIARPSVGVITNVGAAHLRDAGSVDEIVKGKSELGEYVESGGTLVLNADFPQLVKENEKWNLRKITFSLDRPSQFRLKRFTQKGAGYEIEVEDGAAYYVPLLGKGNISNSLAALAVSKLMGISDAEFARAIASMKPMPGRMELEEVGGIRIINDSYNANPVSVSLALETIREIEVRGKKVALLGDMLELGEASGSLHKEIGERAAFLDELYAIGEFSLHIREGAEAKGMPSSRIKTVETREEALNLLKPALASGDLLLIKGSRGMKLEEVFKGLKANRMVNKAKVAK